MLLDTNTIARIKPASLYKRKRPSKPVEQLVLARIKQSNPACQFEFKQSVYASWAIFEYIYRVLKPFLVETMDWTNPNGLFRRLQVFIDQPKWQPEPEGVVIYFTKIRIDSLN